ncbi:MAG: twin arginine-targeting protein translocase TatC, partial [Deltaproteobacteria bacterium RIFOXYD12_FULL_57_12]
RFFLSPLFAAQPALKTLIYTNLTEAFTTYIKVALLVGIICSYPVLLFQAWMFVAPGLLAHEKKLINRVLFWATALFGGGVLFAFFVVLPRMLIFFLGFSTAELEPLPRLSGYLTFVARTCLAFGLAFEIPFLMVMATRTGLVSGQEFQLKRKYYYPAILLLSFLLAAGDFMAAGLLAIPLFGLYEAGILIIKIFSSPA